MGTIIRLAFVGLLGSLLLLFAGGSAQRVASRVTREPVKAEIVGFLAQLLFVPLLVVGSVLLAVTIIGIPLLVLVPVVVVAALAVMLLGFTGVAQGVGQLVTRGDGSGRWTAVAVFWLGLVLLMIPTLSGEALSLAGGSFRVIAITLGLVGFVTEYAAWTTGVGAVILNRFGASAGPRPAHRRTTSPLWRIWARQHPEPWSQNRMYLRLSLSLSLSRRRRPRRSQP